MIKRNGDSIFNELLFVLTISSTPSYSTSMILVHVPPSFNVFVVLSLTRKKVVVTGHSIGVVVVQCITMVSSAHPIFDKMLLSSMNVLVTSSNTTNSVTSL